MDSAKTLGRLGRYRLEKRLGEGGMAEVYKAIDESPGGFAKPVAVKLVRRVLATDPQTAQLFAAEARIAQRLHHGNIVQVVALGEHQQLPYLVMEYVDGLSLASLLRLLRKHGRQLGVAESLFIVERVADALHYAHRLTDESGAPTPVIHRDIHAGNVLVSAEGIVKLADFGIAKARGRKALTMPGQVRGTLGAISPEHARGRPVDAKSDLWATGVLLYEMISGAHPLTHVNDIDDYIRLLDQGLPPMPVCEPADAELAAIVARATAVAPADRYDSMAELRHELEAWRVGRAMRTDTDRLRELVRLCMGRTSVQGGNLAGALLAQLGSATRSTQEVGMATTPAPVTQPTGVRPGTLVAVLAVLGAAVAALVFVLTRPSASSSADAAGLALVVGDAESAPVSRDAAPPDAAVPDAGAPDAGAVPDAALARPADRPVRQKAAPGVLAINLLPYANVTIDGRYRGRTPVSVPIAAGTHRVELHNPDTGQRATKRLVVPSGETVRVTRW